MLKRSFYYVLFSLLVCTTVIPISWAQELVLEEVIVTAVRRDTNLMETPLAVSAITADELAREGVNNILNIGNLVPNMQVGLSPSDSGVSIAIRGITSNNFTELGDPTVGIHFDGIYSPRPQGGLALLFDVERIDILRGPQGTLFGRNSTAGTINVINARPQFEEISGSAELEAANYSTRAFRGWLNIPASEKLAFRVSFMAQRLIPISTRKWTCLILTGMSIWMAIPMGRMMSRPMAFPMWTNVEIITKKTRAPMEALIVMRAV